MLQNLYVELGAGLVVLILTVLGTYLLRRHKAARLLGQDFDQPRLGFQALQTQIAQHCARFGERTILLRKLPFEFTRCYFDEIELHDLDNKDYADSVGKVIRHGDQKGKGWWCWSIFARSGHRDLDHGTCEAINYMYFPLELDPLVSRPDVGPTETCSLLLRQKQIHRAFILLGEITTESLVADSLDALGRHCRWHSAVEFNFRRAKAIDDIQKWKPSLVAVHSDRDKLSELREIFMAAWQEDVATLVKPPDAAALPGDFVIDVPNVTMKDAQKWRQILKVWFAAS